LKNVVKILKATKGLNTKVDPVRLRYSKSSGIQELAVAVNVDIDDTGRISRRKGFTQRVAGTFHSLFCHKDTVLCVTGDAFSVLNADYTATPLRNVTLDERMSYCAVDDKIYYTNGYQTGYVFNRLSYGWVQGTYVGPETDKELSDPPIGSVVAYYNNRVYVAQGKTLWYSEPFNYNAFDLHANFMSFEGQIQMVRPVSTGIFVGTDKITYFLSGANPAEGFNRLPVCNYAPFRHSDIPLNGKMVLDPESEPTIQFSSEGESCLWISKEGVCYGGPQGSFQNLTQEKLDLPESLVGNSMIIDDRFIGLIDP
jgi:hypothetical protein